LKDGGVIRPDHMRHQLRPMSPRTRDRLLPLAREVDLIALTWGR
jgi:4-hydroxy-tetrahydrodipicolinate synthase